jgi:glycosyltransferase involved in cell wall biosynthesis
MKIGVDARSLLQREVRGEGRTLQRLYRELSRQQPSWQVTMYGERDPTAEIANEFRCRSMSIPGSRFNSWEQLAFPLAAALATEDLLHCASSSAPTLVPCPFVLTVHDIIPIVFDDGQTDAQRLRFETSLGRALRRAAGIISVSHHTKADLVRHFNVPERRITVIHWGTDIKGEAHASQVPLGRPADQSTVLAYGGSAPRKNTSRLMQAFGLCARHNRRARLVVVGVSAAETRLALAAAAEDIGIGDRVNLLGFVSDDELNATLAEASVVFYPSLYEGFGMPLVEAMGAGVPIVASDRTSIPEVVGDAGMLIDPTDVHAMADALSAVLDNPSLRAELSERSRARARQFSWATCAESTSNVFTAALNPAHA